MSDFSLPLGLEAKDVCGGEAAVGACLGHANGKLAGVDEAHDVLAREAEEIGGLLCGELRSPRDYGDLVPREKVVDDLPERRSDIWAHACRRARDRHGDRPPPPEDRSKLERRARGSDG